MGTYVHTPTTMKLSSALAFAAFAIPYVAADNLEIVDWNTTEYLNDKGYAFARVTMGDNITFTGDGSDETYLFNSWRSARNCDFDDATKVDDGFFVSWPVDANFRRAAKGKKFFGTNSTDCDKLTVMIAPKIFKPKNGGCEGDNDIIEAKNFTRGRRLSYFKCAKYCRAKRDSRSSSL